MSSSSWHSRPVFVYGTLKVGQPNNCILQSAVDKSQAKFLGHATTADCWPLIIYSAFNIPFLLDCKGTGQRVVGDLFEVDESTLQTLDELERHPAWYTRDTLLTCLNSSPDDLIECDAYLMMNFRRDLLTSETLIAEYLDTPERRYVLPSDRAAAVIIDIKENDAT